MLYSIDSIPAWFMPLYWMLWLGVARVAVAIRRVNRRERTRRELVMRLWRWKDC